MPATPPPHGTRSRYLWRARPCRCEECRAANTRYHTDRRRNASEYGEPELATTYLTADEEAEIRSMVLALVENIARKQGLDPEVIKACEESRRCYQRGCRRNVCVEANRNYSRKKQRGYDASIAKDDPFLKEYLES